MNKFKSLVIGALCASFGLTSVACGESKQQATGAGASLQLSKMSVFLEDVGSTQEIKVRTNKEGDKVTWTSSNQQVATVENGVVTAKGNGVTTIKVKANGKTAECNVVVGKVEFDLATQAVALMAGQSQSIETNLTLSGQEIADVVENYTSNNAAVATVTGEGMVTAVASGETTVSVSAVYFGKTFTKELNMKVSSIPEVSIYEEAVITAVGQKYKINAGLVIDGEEASGYTLQYESANVSVATISSDGVISGIGKGSTEVKVKATYGGKTYEKSVGVTVNGNVDIDIALNAANVNMVPTDRLLAGKINQFDLQLIVTKNGEPVSGKEVTWTIEDSKVATLTSEGYVATVKAKGVGETKVVATVEHNGETLQAVVNIKCETPIFDVADFSIDASVQTGADFLVYAPKEIPVDTIDEIIYGGKPLTVLSKDATNNTLMVKNAGFVMGEEKISVKSGITVFNSYLVYAKKVLRTKAEFATFLSTDYKTNKAGDYYVLGADIDMEGENVSKLQGFVGRWPGLTSWTGEKIDWAGERVVAWNGHFDGRGYAITNAKMVGGLFTNTGGASIVENVAVFDCIILSEAGGIICNDSCGIVRNCYMKGQLNGDMHGGVMGTAWPQSNTSDCVVVVSEREGANHGVYSAIPDCQGPAKNLYVVTADRTEIASKDGVGQLFASVNELNAAAVAKNLSGRYWKIVNGQLYFGNHLVG